MHEDGSGGAPTSDELTVDDLTQLAARDAAVNLNLTEQERTLLLAKRRACAMREHEHGLVARYIHVRPQSIVCECRHQFQGLCKCSDLQSISPKFSSLRRAENPRYARGAT